MNEINLWVIFGIVARIASIIILIFMVIPVQWRELHRQYKRRRTMNTRYWRLAMELLLIVLITVVCAIVPVTYQGTQIFTSNDSFNLQNLAIFFTNFGLLIQSIGWARIYRTKYDDR